MPSAALQYTRSRIQSGLPDGADVQAPLPVESSHGSTVNKAVVRIEPIAGIQADDRFLSASLEIKTRRTSAIWGRRNNARHPVESIHRHRSECTVKLLLLVRDDGRADGKEDGPVRVAGDRAGEFEALSEAGKHDILDRRIVDQFLEFLTGGDTPFATQRMVGRIIPVIIVFKGNLVIDLPESV